MGSSKQLLLIAFFTLGCLIEKSQSSIKVCKNYLDFYVPFSKNCWSYDYDHLDPAEIAKTWNFKTETYDLLLNDGYIIGVFRVYKHITKKNPVILGHGALLSALSWVTAGNNSLAYVLGNLGYDVWMVSWRGTEFSKRNINFVNNQTNLEYWKNCTFHQMGIYDLKSTIELVYNHTRQKVLYIGHSMGTTCSYIYCSLHPDLCKQRILGMISLAPAGYIKPYGPQHWISTFPLWSFIRAFFYTPLFNGEFLQRAIFHIPLIILSKTPLGNLIAKAILDSALGIDLTPFDPTYAPIFINSLPDSVSVDTLTHYAQIQAAKRFQQFDFGKRKNLHLYESEVPPEYRLDNIPIPVAMFVGGGDWAQPNRAANMTYLGLSQSSRCGYHIIHGTYNHLGFLISKNNPKLLFKPLVQKMMELQEGTCIDVQQ